MCHLLHQVITHKLFIFWMKSEPRWQLCLYHAYVAHFSLIQQRYIGDGEIIEGKKFKLQVRNFWEILVLEKEEVKGCIYKWEEGAQSGEANM